MITRPTPIGGDLTVRPPTSAVGLHGAAEARVASWRAAFRGLVPRISSTRWTLPPSRWVGWRRSIAARRSSLYVAIADSPGGTAEVVGYAGIGPERDEAAPAGTRELYALFVHPDRWGTGAGRALTDAAVADLQSTGRTQVWLWVLEANDRARAFYRRCGFTETGDRTLSSLADLPEIRLTPTL